MRSIIGDWLLKRSISELVALNLLYSLPLKALFRIDGRH